MSERRQRFILALFIAIFLFLLGLTEREAKGAELDAAVGTSHSVVDALGLDARAAGLGWAVTAVDLGAPGQNFNPASMALATERQLYLGHVDWVLDTSLSQSLALMPMAGGNVVGLGLLYFDQGTVDEVLDDGSYTGERLGARDLHFSLGLGHRFVTGVSVGARFTVFQKTLGWERASGMTGDLGVLTDDMGGFRLGAAVQAMGPPLRFRETEDPAPLRYRLGVSHAVDVGVDFRMQNSLDLVIPRDNYNSFHVGTEWEYHRLLAFRAGYQRTLLEDGTPDSDRFSYGAGFRLGGYRFDYAYSPKDDFDPVHRFSVNFALGAPPAAAPAPTTAAMPRDDGALTEADLDSTETVGHDPLPRVTVLKGITFDLNSSEIAEASQPMLEEILQRLVHTPSVEAVEIQGHTDNSGDPDFNKRLSLQRARAVRDYFALHGYPTGKMGVMGFGDSRPIVANDTPDGRAANRRIELHVIRTVDG
ncbi:MAG: PorV/PorQ family protein [Candidatus Krumholzibacteriia bacterium]|nr:OmpA family protein [bacterium]MCB9513520.1 OmpA family protein [Candidatus Latescibacterota bacterium]MCB9515633.1 OmpA family protein [Candidatus Latescibacterota bacterium]